MKGTVKWYNLQKGYGFIQGEDGTDYFVHHTALPERLRLRENDVVSFEPADGERGPKAINCTLATDAPDAGNNEPAGAESAAEAAAPSTEEPSTEENSAQEDDAPEATAQDELPDSAEAAPEDSPAEEEAPAAPDEAQSEEDSEPVEAAEIAEVEEAAAEVADEEEKKE